MGTPEVALVPMPTREGLDDQAGPLIERARALTVTTPETYEIAQVIRRDVKQAAKVVAEHYAPFKRKAKEAYDSVRSAESADLKKIEDIEEILKPKVNAFLQDEERKRREEEARLREEARKKQEADALRVAAELERRGKAAAAERVLETAIAAPPPPVILAKQVPKVAGVVVRKIVKYTIEDAALVPREFCEPSPGRIMAEVRKLGLAAVIPGVNVYEDYAG